MSVDHRILIKNKYVYDCMKRSELVKDWRWVAGGTMAGWDPYNISSRLLRDDAIVLLVREDNTVTYTTHAEYFENAVPWAQWCEKMTIPWICSSCAHWACMNRKELIGACTIWHDSGKTWPKSWESCPHWEHEKRKEDRND